jgi:hypothetical protein
MNRLPSNHPPLTKLRGKVLLLLRFNGTVPTEVPSGAWA